MLSIFSVCLKRHLIDCGLIPAVRMSSCRLVVKRQDLTHHKIAVYELPRVQCHSCYTIKEKMEAFKGEAAVV